MATDNGRSAGKAPPGTRQPEPPQPDPNRGAVADLVERVTFHNAETRFRVLRVKARSHRDPVAVVGHAATISAGEFV